jgi:large subunit ribosomal protein L17
MINALITYERITTTKAKALAIRQVAEKMITRAKEDTVHNRRVIGRRITDEKVLAKLFVEVGPRFVKRPGGYTRIYKLGPRFGDAAEMVILELLDRKEQESTDASKSETPKSKKVSQKSDTKSDKKITVKKSDGKTGDLSEPVAKAAKPKTAKPKAPTAE